jgi:adenine-specific DNA-methyltransferase
LIKKLDLPDPATGSRDLTEANLEHMKELFPEAWTEGKIDFDVLKQLLGGVVDESAEKYGLNWHGKRQARQLALTPSTGTLRPRPDESIEWDTTQNIMVEGDNLEVLKLLDKSYAGRVKMVYIDPPYNTGKDFVYPDNFRDSIRNYLELTGQVGADGQAVVSAKEKSGRLHTEWLNMMYPRMVAARRLLRDDGALFISIDDTEVANLRLVLDEIFGSENFAAIIAWKKRSSPDARDTIGSIHDYIVCYVKRSERIKAAIQKIPLSDQRIESYTNPDNDPRGDWASVDMTGMTGRATKDQFFPVELPSGRIIEPPDGRSWGLIEKTFLDLRADNRIWFGKSGDNVPRIKKFLSESDGQVVPSFWDMADVGSNDEAKKEVNDLMGRPDVFDTPKPLRLIERMIQIATHKESHSIILDFFGGSGTTGHASWEQNAKDGGNRRFIVVQLPYALDPNVKEQRSAAAFTESIGRPQNAAELTKERLRRAAQRLTDSNPLSAAAIGFRVFKLDSSNIRAWRPQEQDLEQLIIDSVDHLEAGRDERDILFELLLRLGLDLSVHVDSRTIAGKTVYVADKGALIGCFTESINRHDVEVLAQGISEWHAALNPDAETVIVFRDSAFEDDIAKTNLTAILEQHGLSNIRSI